MSQDARRTPVPLRSGRHGLSRDAVVSSQRERLITGMIEAAAQGGYSNVTIDDVCRRARTAKRTFYENFNGKEACFLVAHDQIVADLIDATGAALAHDHDPELRLAHGVRGFLGWLDAHPDEARIVLVEISGVGPAGRLHRTATVQGFADAIIGWRDADRALGNPVQPVSPTEAFAIVGVVLEPVTMALLSDGDAPLADRADEILDILRRVML